MVEWIKKSKRKASGGINNSVNAKSKSLSDKGGIFSKTTIDAKDKKYTAKTRGGSSKLKVTKTSTALISDKAKVSKGKIINVVENNANKQFVRQKVITKGAIIIVEFEGKEYKAKVTSRPGQSGQVTAVIIK